MAYQLSDLITEVRTKAKDPSFDSTLITYYLNDTQDEVLGRHIFSFMEGTENTTLNVNDTTHAYPTDLQSVIGVRLTDPATATTVYTPTYLPHRQFFDTYPNVSSFPSAAPIYYTDYGRALQWSHKLDKAYILEMRYLKRPTSLVNSTDVPVIPQEFKRILIRGALAGIEEYRDNYDVAAVHRRKLEDLEEDLVARYSPRQLNRLGKATTRGQ